MICILEARMPEISQIACDCRENCNTLVYESLGRRTSHRRIEGASALDAAASQLEGRQALVSESVDGFNCGYFIRQT